MEGRRVMWKVEEGSEGLRGEGDGGAPDGGGEGGGWWGGVRLTMGNEGEAIM